jgi:hypothetical protein
MERDGFAVVRAAPDLDLLDLRRAPDCAREARQDRLAVSQGSQRRAQVDPSPGVQAADALRR